MYCPKNIFPQIDHITHQLRLFNTLLLQADQRINIWGIFTPCKVNYYCSISKILVSLAGYAHHNLKLFAIMHLSYNYKNLKANYQTNVIFFFTCVAMIFFCPIRYTINQLQLSLTLSTVIFTCNDHNYSNS